MHHGCCTHCQPCHCTPQQEHPVNARTCQQPRLAGLAMLCFRTTDSCCTMRKTDTRAQCSSDLRHLALSSQMYRHFPAALSQYPRSSANRRVCTPSRVTRLHHISPDTRRHITRNLDQLACDARHQCKEGTQVVAALIAVTLRHIGTAIKMQP